MSTRYGIEDIEGLRSAVIELRDGAMSQGDMEWTVKLSHVVAVLAQYIKDYREGATLNELD